ncbi:MAG: bifunctional precorrin-2 dehydrogenase/sirohydrochlorin ferrochelatase [Eubacterium sp.]
MTLFPFFEDIDGKAFLVIGGGKVAKGKVERLKQFTQNIIVVAEKTQISDVKVLNKKFEEADLDLGDYVICATDDRELNKRISLLCQRKSIPVNIVDNPELCTFIFPSLIKKGDLTIGISTGGKSPLTAQYIRKEIECLLPEDIDKIIDEMGELRETLKKEIPD